MISPVAIRVSISVVYTLRLHVSYCALLNVAFSS
jgi:hypothetical protein